VRCYKNFFQPVIRLKEKVRDKGRIHRKYCSPKTPYGGLMESEHLPTTTKNRFTRIYRSLDPAELKRNIETKTKFLFHLYQEKECTVTPSPSKKQTPQVRSRSYLLNDRTPPTSVT